MQIESSTFRKIKDLYGYPIYQGHVGRRVLMREFDLTRSEAVEVLDTIRSNEVDPDEVIVLDKIDEVEYKDEEDQYVFHGEDPFGEPCSLTETGDNVRSMKRDYCMRGYTQKETAIKAGYDPVVFVEIRKAMDWTHNSVPATDEEIRANNAEEMAEKLALEQKKSDTRKGIEKVLNRELRKDAKKWRQFDQVILEEMRETIAPKAQPIEQVFQPRKDEEPAAAVVPTFDIHFGKQGILDKTGEPYDRGVAEKRLIDNTERLMQDLARYNIEKIYLAFGSDFFHVDTQQGTTTGQKIYQGTPQEMDGTPAEIFTQGCDLLRKHVDMLRQVAPIDAFVIPGNHDRLLSVALAKYMQAVYENVSGVDVDMDTRTRKYRSYGITLMGFDHGDGLRKGDIKSVILGEAREHLANTKETVFFTGHLHHELKQDLGGVTAYQVGSPSGNDTWHDINAYTAARKQTTAYVLNQQRGMHAHLNYPVAI